MAGKVHVENTTNDRREQHVTIYYCEWSEATTYYKNAFSVALSMLGNAAIVPSPPLLTELWRDTTALLLMPPLAALAAALTVTVAVVVVVGIRGTLNGTASTV